ncbi:MAG TPA: IclR family transcriptional regulator [Ramlibacter sp.]|jgi:DNA-binding IclR family transcriptional regulator|nr:IclR family transcriptional regulator [Ramlibacter sp.]
MRQEEEAPARASGSQVVQRVALLMRLVAAGQRSGLRLADLHRAADLERPTAHRLLQALVAERLLRQDGESRRYFLGPAMYEMGLAASPQLALRDICHPHLERIAQMTGDTVFLTERSGLDGVCTDRAEGKAPIKAYVLEVGKRRPLVVGGGATAILSAMDDIELDRVCRANLERTLKRFPRYSEAVLRRSIARARARGYVLSKVLELPDVRTVAVPIREPGGAPVAAISVSSVATRMDDERAAEVAASLRRAIDDIEGALADRNAAAGGLQSRVGSSAGGRQPKNSGR